MKMSMAYSTHLPILIKLFNMTEGPILEIGTGLYSTPYLHWACFEKKRKLVSYDDQAKYFNPEYISDYHESYLVDDWGIALIDHHPSSRRKEEIRRLANSVDYIVVHDTEKKRDRQYRYSEIYPLFKYHYKFRGATPHTSILSNFKDLKEFKKL